MTRPESRGGAGRPSRGRAAGDDRAAVSERAGGGARAGGDQRVGGDARAGGDQRAGGDARAGGSERAGGASRTARALLGLALVAGLVVAGRLLPLDAAHEWVAALGPWGPLALGALYVVATVMAVPGVILTLAAGGLFGLAVGSITVSLAATAGACCAFLVGRYLARGWVARRFVAERPRFAAIDRAVGREGFKIVLLTRLSPLFPFNLLNYGYGLTSVSFKDYALASWLGMIPGTVMYVYLGNVLGEVALSAERERTPGEWVLLGVGLVAAVAVAVYVARLARAALARQAVVDAEGQAAARGVG